MKNPREIYYLFEDEAEAPAAESAEVSSALAATPIPASVTAPVAAPAAAIEDVPLNAVDILASVIAWTLKKAKEVLLSKFHQRSCDGKSTLQNEILAISSSNLLLL